MIHFEKFNPTKERHMILGIVLLSGLLCAGLLFAGFFPARARKNERLLEMVFLTARIKPYLAPEEGRPPPEQQIETEKALNARLLARAESLKAEVCTFPIGSSTPSQLLASSEGGRIDFKVALFNARQTLTRRAEEMKVPLPPDLGLDATIAAGEDSETRLWQLAATVRLLDNTLTSGVISIERIQPHPPLMIDLQHPEYAGMWEYPISIRLRCEFPALLELLEYLRQPDHFFSIRRIQIESRGGTDAALLYTQITAGASVIRGVREAPRIRSSKESPSTLHFSELGEPLE